MKLKGTWFYRSVVSCVLIAALFAVTLPTTGCSSATVVAEINTVLTEATNVLVVAEPNAAWVPQLQVAIVALKQAEAGWQGGGAVQDVIAALNTVEAITAVIPLTEQYSPLIDVLVAGIEAVLELLPPGATVTLSGKAGHNPHIGRVTLAHHAFHSRTKEFTTLWNVTARDNGLVGAVIQ